MSKAKAAPVRRGKKPTPATSHDASSPDESGLKDELLQTTKPYAEWQMLSQEVRDSLAEVGFTNPTPVQAAAIEPGMSGRDLVVQAKTGTGKTAGFGIPLLEQITPGGDSPSALILAPTRELARQVAAELTGLSKHKGTTIAALYGGISIGEQIDQLKAGVDIVVGTPGRILDHIKRKTLLTDKIHHIALDEADEMLSMGFYLEVTSIIQACKNNKQMMLFSATIPPDIEGLVRQFTTKPIRLMVSGDDRRVEGIGHHIYFLNEEVPRPRNLLYILEYESPETAIIFCNRKSDTALVASYLLQQGKKAEALHGDMEQRDRERVLEKIRNNEVQFLVATDVASRGIDISGLTHVINYHFPPSTELYIHRVGRTGRQGRHGTAISLAHGSDSFQIMQLKRLHNIFFDTRRIPDANEVVKVAASRHIGELFTDALNTYFEPYLGLADGLLNDQRGRFVIAYLLKLYHDGEIKSIQESLEQIEPPPPPKRPEPTPEERQPERSREPQPERSRETQPETKKEPKKESNDQLASADSNDNDSDANGMIKLYLKGAGASEGFDPEKLLQLVCEISSVDAEQVGTIQVERSYSYVNVIPDVVDTIIESFQDPQGNGNVNITAEVAKKRPRRRRKR